MITKFTKDYAIKQTKFIDKRLGPLEQHINNMKGSFNANKVGYKLWDLDKEMWEVVTFDDYWVAVEAHERVTQELVSEFQSIYENNINNNKEVQ